MFNVKTIGSIIIGIILLNNSLYTIFPLPGIVDKLAIILGGILLIAGHFINF